MQIHNKYGNISDNTILKSNLPYTRHASCTSFALNKLKQKHNKIIQENHNFTNKYRSDFQQILHTFKRGRKKKKDTTENNFKKY